MQNAREKRDSRMVGACTLSGSVYLLSISKNGVRNFINCFCHSVRKTVLLRKALFDISKESEMKIMIRGKMAFRVKEKCTRTFKKSLVSRISWNG